MFSCTSCRTVYDEPELEECVSCGTRYCQSCGAVGLVARLCRKCGERVMEKIHGTNMHISIPDSDIAKREKLLMKFDEIDMKERHQLHVSFEENLLDDYTRTPMHFSVPEVMKPKEVLVMKFPELLMEPTKQELHVTFEDPTMLHKRKAEELHVSFPENFLQTDVLTNMALKQHK